VFTDRESYLKNGMFEGYDYIFNVKTLTWNVYMFEEYSDLREAILNEKDEE